MFTQEYDRVCHANAGTCVCLAAPVPLPATRTCPIGHTATVLWLAHAASVTGLGMSTTSSAMGYASGYQHGSLHIFVSLLT